MEDFLQGFKYPRLMDVGKTYNFIAFMGSLKLILLDSSFPNLFLLFLPGPYPPVPPPELTTSYFESIDALHKPISW